MKNFLFYLFSKIADSRVTVGSTQHVPPGGIASASSGITNQQPQNVLLTDLDSFLGMLHDLSALGAAMRRVMTVSLTNEKVNSLKYISLIRM